MRLGGVLLYFNFSIVTQSCCIVWFCHNQSYIVRWVIYSSHFKQMLKRHQCFLYRASLLCEELTLVSALRTSSLSCKKIYFRNSSTCSRSSNATSLFSIVQFQHHLKRLIDNIWFISKLSIFFLTKCTLCVILQVQNIIFRG